MQPTDIALLVGAGFAAGVVNAVAGAGSLISFPALLATGMGPVAANVTNNMAMLPGYIGGTIGYRRELAGQGQRVARLAVFAAAGGGAGAALLLVLPPSVFGAVAPFLILAACGLLAFERRLERLAIAMRRPLVLEAMVLAGCVYGGYFGAGLGIALLAMLSIGLDDDLHGLNALKGVLSVLNAAVAACAFAIFGPVDWAAAALMATAALAGGFAGVAAARRLPARGLRWLVAAFGVAVAVALML